MSGSKSGSFVPTRPTPTDPKRCSAYHYSLAGGLGTGSYVQDIPANGEEQVLTAGFDLTTTADPDFPGANGFGPSAPGGTFLWKSGQERDSDGFVSGGGGDHVNPQNGTAPMTIGCRQDQDSWLDGTVRRVAVFNRKLTTAEVADIYAHWSLVEGTTADAPGPAAPTGFVATPLDGGAHATWTPPVTDPPPVRYQITATKGDTTLTYNLLNVTDVQLAGLENCTEPPPPPPEPVSTLTLRGSVGKDFFFTDSATDYAMPLPAGTEVGELLVLSIATVNITFSDSRFTSYGNGAYIGYATDLSDVVVHRTLGQYAQAQLVVLKEKYAPVVGTAFATGNDAAPATVPVVTGVKAAICCWQANFATVFGWCNVAHPPWVNYHPTTNVRSAGVATWSDPAATDSPASTFTPSGGPGIRNVTVIGLR